jgi:periplasmic protein CpxP/Spy
MKSPLRSTLVLLLAALPLAAQTAPVPAPMAAPGPRAGRMARALNLTDVQKTSIRAVREKHRSDLALHRDAARQAGAALRVALQNPSTPEVQLRTLYDKAAVARFEMLLARRSVHLEVRALLTPDQIAKAAEMRGLARAKRRERMHHLRMAAGMAG